MNETSKAGDRKASIRIGVAGWSYPDWNGIVYPSPKPPRFDPLAFLTSFFDTIEINSTFYRAATPRVTSSWVRRCGQNPNFRFTVKLLKSFTHERIPSVEDEKAVKEGLAPLQESERLGAVLLQFPWSFKNDPPSGQYLAELLDRFDAYPLVVEVRHASWDHQDFYRFLAERAVGFCNIDQPRFGRSLGPSQTSTGLIGYVRLHGRNYKDWFREHAGRDARYDYLYSKEELEPWLEKIDRIADESRETYVIANNHFRGQAAVNAIQLQARIGGKPVDAPPSLVAAYPILEEVVEPSGPTDPSRLF